MRVLVDGFCQFWADGLFHASVVFVEWVTESRLPTAGPNQQQQMVSLDGVRVAVQAGGLKVAP